MEESYRYREEYLSGKFTGGLLDYVRLFYSFNYDEAYYYEWSRLVLGKPLEPEYPVEQRVYSPLRQRLKDNPQWKLPYRDIFFEYPPLSALPILTAGILSPNYLVFTRVFAFLASLAYLGCLWLVYGIWKRIPENQKFSWPLVLSFSALSLLALGQIFVTRLDVFPTLLFLLALYNYIKGKYYTSSTWIAFGTLTKAFPILLAPLFALCLLFQKKYRTLLIALGWFFLWFLSINLILGIITGGDYLKAIAFHSSRGIQIESFYALISFLPHLLWGTPIRVFLSHHSLNVQSPHTTWLLRMSNYLPLLLFAGIYYRSWRSLKKGALAPTSSLTIYPALLLIFSFIISFKVFSPQYLIWLTPLIFLASPKKQIVFPFLFLIVLVLSQLIFPMYYHLLANSNPVVVGMLLLRNMGLLGLFIWLIFKWGQAEKIALKI